jgi:O-antigen ligase
MDNAAVKKPIGSRLITERPGAVVLWMLFLLVFPLFSVEKADVFGFEGLPMFAPTKLIRLAWFFSMVVTFSAVSFHYLTNQQLKKLKFRGVDLVPVAYLLGAGISILLNTPTNLVAWYRFAELTISLLASILILRVLLHLHDESGAALIINRAIYRMMHVACVVLFVLGLYDLDLVFFQEFQERFRFGGYVYGPNYLALLLALALISAFYLYSRKAISAYALSLALMVTHLGVFLTGSRTGIVILLFVDVVGNLKFKLIKNQKLAFLWKHLQINAFVLLALFAFYQLYSDTSWLSGLVGMVGTGEDPLSDLLSLNNRITVYATALNGIIEHPVFGVGYVEGVRAYFAGNFPLTFWIPPHAHNSILEIILAQGFAGGMIILAFIGLCWVKSIRILYQNRGWSSEQISFALIFTVLLLFSLTNVPFASIVSNLGMLFIISGLVVFSAERKTW